MATERKKLGQINKSSTIPFLPESNFKFIHSEQGPVGTRNFGCNGIFVTSRPKGNEPGCSGSIKKASEICQESSCQEKMSSSRLHDICSRKCNNVYAKLLFSYLKS